MWVHQEVNLSLGMSVHGCPRCTLRWDRSHDPKSTHQAYDMCSRMCLEQNFKVVQILVKRANKRKAFIGTRVGKSFERPKCGYTRIYILQK